MNQNVFLSLIALDAYNRGYDVSIGGLELFGRLGEATIVSDSLLLGRLEDGERVDQSVGLYAIAYEWNGETIISYRGTDFNGDIVADIVNGWPVGAGFGGGAQADLAIRLYNAVAGADSVFDTADRDVTLTGHSLGGGLAANNDNVALDDAV